MASHIGGGGSPCNFGQQGGVGGRPGVGGKRKENKKRNAAQDRTEVLSCPAYFLKEIRRQDRGRTEVGQRQDRGFGLGFTKESL